MAADVAGRVSGKRIKEEEKEEKEEEGGGEGWDLESKESEEAERLLHINSFMMVPNHLRKFFSFFSFFLYKKVQFREGRKSVEENRWMP